MTTQTTNVTIKQLNDKVVLVKPEFHITTGRKKLLVEDLRLPDGSELPPEALVSLGSKKVIDPEEIKQFTKLRDQANAACEKVGMKFLGGYIVPVDEADELLNVLDSIVQTFGQKRMAFLNDYESIVDRWCRENPQWNALIRQAVPAKSVVAQRLSADYVVFQVAPVDGKVPERLENKVQGLGGQLFGEIAADARRFVDESIYERQTKEQKLSGLPKQLRKDGVTQKALRPINSMREKMASLAFLDGRIRPVLDHIDQVLASMPDKGRITDQHYTNLLQLSLILSDEEKMMQLSDILAATQQPVSDPMFDQPIPVVGAATPQPAVGEIAVDDFGAFSDFDQSSVPAQSPTTNNDLLAGMPAFAEMPDQQPDAFVEVPASSPALQVMGQSPDGIDDVFADLRADLNLPSELQPQSPVQSEPVVTTETAPQQEPVLPVETTVPPVQQPAPMQSAGDWF